MELPRIILTPAAANQWRRVRVWLYGVTLAVLPVAIYYGYVAMEAAPLWLAVAVALLNVTPKDQGRDFYLEED